MSIGIYILPSTLKISIGKAKGYNNEILVSNTGMKTGSIRDISKDRPVNPHDVPKTVVPAAQHDPIVATRPCHLKIFTEKHNDEKLVITLLIVGAGLIAYDFW